MARVKTNFKDARKQLLEFKNQSQDKLPSVLEKEISDSIQRGISPVKGFGRFIKYSDSYIAQIKAKVYRNKRVRPINLKLSGELLKSLKVEKSQTGLKVSFDNFLANIHNKDGAGKSKTVRRMLPTEDGEEFSRSITMRLREVLKGIAKNIFKR